MRMNLLAVVLIGMASAAFAQSSGIRGAGSSGTSTTPPATTSGQSIAGTTTSGQSLTTRVAPAPLVTTPPINPLPQSAGVAPRSTFPASRRAKPGHHTMGTANSYQNGEFGTVNSNAVANGTANSAPLISNMPTMSSNSNTASIIQHMNGPANAPGTVAQPTPAATSTKQTTATQRKSPQH